jgi:hypothetical protein
MSLTLACSGPGAFAAIYFSTIYAWYFAGISAVIVLAIAYDHLRLRTWSWRLLLAGLLMALHPAWTVSAVAGDCGGMKKQASMTVLILLIVLVILQYAVPHMRYRNRSQPISM